MRNLAILFGVLGAMGSGFLSVRWYIGFHDQKDTIEQMWKQAQATQDPKLKAALEEIDRARVAAYAMLCGVVVAPVALLLVRDRWGFVAAVLFLAAFLAPFFWQQEWLACCTFGFGLAAAFSFLDAAFSRLGLLDTPTVNPRAPQYRPKQD